MTTGVNIHDRVISQKSNKNLPNKTRSWPIRNPGICKFEKRHFKAKLAIKLLIDGLYTGRVTAYSGNPRYLFYTQASIVCNIELMIWRFNCLLKNECIYVNRHSNLQEISFLTHGKFGNGTLLPDFVTYALMRWDIESYPVHLSRMSFPA